MIAVEKPEHNVRRRLVRNVNLSTSIPGSIGLSSYKFKVEVFPCLCDVIFIVQLVKLNGQACYFKFVQDYLEENPHGAHDLLRTFGIVTRRDPSSDADSAMPQKKGSPYPRRCLLCYAEPNESRSEFGHWIAGQLQLLPTNLPILLEPTTDLNTESVILVENLTNPFVIGFVTKMLSWY